jgi:hypothetical protein
MGVYRNIGAVAELFDISCLTRIPSLFNQITNGAIAIWKAAPSSVTPQDVIKALGMFNTDVVLGKFFLKPITPPPKNKNKNNLIHTGQHYYVPNPTTPNSINPKWDFTSSTGGNPNAYIIAAKSFGSAAPTGSQDIDWVFLTNIDEGGVGGDLADAVYRTDTKLGQPGSGGCVPGSGEIEVRYASKYCEWIKFSLLAFEHV